MTEKVKYKIVLVGYLTGIFSFDKIKDWVDQVIKQENNPHAIFFDLASALTPSEVVQILNNAIVHISNDELSEVENVYVGFFGNLLWEQQKKHEEIEHCILDFYDKADIQLNETVGEFLGRLSDDYALRQEGFGGNVLVPKELVDFVNPFRKKFENLFQSLSQNEKELLLKIFSNY